MISIATWNVLHRVHAENWGEDIVTRWPDEADRVAAISARLARRTEQVIALQEVSGDQLAGIRQAMPDRTIHALRYPRVPRLRRSEVYSLREREEYLVLLIAGPGKEIAATPFDDDPGKGALAVDVAGTLVIATHVTGDDRRVSQLGRLAELAAPTPAYPAAAVLGDFNIDRATVESALGNGFTAAPLPADAPPTRPPGAGFTALWIDHVVVRGATVATATVEDMTELSDHNLVTTTI